MTLWKNLVVLPLLASLLGCAPFTAQQVASRFERPPACQELLVELDEKVATAGVRDASGYPVTGFPYLRANRFLEALGKHLKDKEEQDQWVGLMFRLGLEGREKEILNLPGSLISASDSEETVSVQRKELVARAQDCSRRLLEHDRSRPELFEVLSRSVKVPDEYSTLMRTVGLYPVMYMPIALITNKVRQRFRAWYSADLQDLPVTGKLESFAPVGGSNPGHQEIKDILNASMSNPLRVPMVATGEGKKIAAFFAPVIIQDVAAPYDLPGRIVRAGTHFSVSGERPTIYYYFSYGFLHERPILQINYVTWYSARAGKSTPWMEKGHLDGSTIRVSLDADGNAFMVDIMNNCGCYHLLVPDRDRVVQTKSRPLAPDLFVPQWLPKLLPGERLGVRVNSGWHQVERVLAAEVAADSSPYELIPYDVLESLPAGNGRSSSLFDAKGIVAESKRIEPYLLFSFGIPRIGYMRQRGHHATEFNGRIHFDDPYLFERFFILR